MPKNNQAYWRRKFEDNRARDARAMRKLKDIGWKSHIVWECEAMNPTVLASCLKQIFGKRV